jgi:hypothetical protein
MKNKEWRSGSNGRVPRKTKQNKTKQTQKVKNKN